MRARIAGTYAEQRELTYHFSIFRTVKCICGHKSVKVNQRNELHSLNLHCCISVSLFIVVQDFFCQVESGSDVWQPVGAV